MNNSRLLHPYRRPNARLIIADDHELSRAGLRTMLTGQRGLELVGEASNGHEALELCRRLQPNLALLDIRMPQLDGLAACRAIKRTSPGTSIILITMHENPEYLLEALKAGAAGYILKDITQRELLNAVRRVLQGESILDSETVVRLLNHLTGNLPPAQASSQVRLTPREIEVLQLLAQGQTNREIARKLTLSISTVKIHVEHILEKLSVSDRTQAAVRAIELGLIRRTYNEF